MTKADLSDWDGCVRRLACQAPVWSPGTRHGDHALTLGYLVGEVVRDERHRVKRSSAAPEK